MANEMVVLQGKRFTVELQSMLGSSGFGWSLTGLSKGIALLNTTTTPSTFARMVAPVIQKFEFVAVAAPEDKAEIEFTMISFATMEVSKQKHTVLVKVIPSDSEEFVKLSENSEPMFRDVCNSMPPYGFPSPKEVQDSVVNAMYGYNCGPFNPLVLYGFPGANQDVTLKYGYPCGLQDAVNVKYGYPCANQDVVVKYGYPCGLQDAVNVKYGYPCANQQEPPVVKYGYPCGMQDTVKCANQQDPTVLKYGYPCVNQDVVVKYGFPCGVQDAVNVKYGYPCGDQDVVVKYGYPCGAKDAVNVKYGYPCGDQDVLVKYGYPCGVQSAVNVKYGYPCGTQDAPVMYGFRCDNQKS